MCDKVASLPKDNIRALVTKTINQGKVSFSEIASNIKKIVCLDGKCDYRATSYILTIIKEMIQNGELILDNSSSISVNEKYEFVKTPEVEITKITNKYELTGDNKVKISRTEHFFSSWSKIYVGQIIEVLLVPEKDNPVDSNAIAIFYDGKQIGYLPRESSFQLNEEITTKTKDGFNCVASGEVIKPAMMGTKNCILSLP